MVGSYALILDKQECPMFFEMTAKIVSNATEQRYDHCYDALMYGIMELYDSVYMGIKLKALKNRPDPETNFAIE